MTLPPNFNDFEHLQNVIRRLHNLIVREEFRDLSDEEISDPDINIPRRSLYQAATIKDDDTAAITILRMFFFYFSMRKAQDLQQPILGIPLGQLEATRKHRPQVSFYFVEDLADVEEGYEPVTGEISYRLMTETSETIQTNEIELLAQRIKQRFGTGNGKVWRKGKDLFSYTDKSSGYQFQILARSETDAKDLITDVLFTNNDSPNFGRYLNTVIAENAAEKYPTLPEIELILNKQRRRARKRPIADVRFQYASILISGLRPIVLYDRSFRYLDALVTDLP